MTTLGRITKVDGVRIVATFYEKMPPFIIHKGIHHPSPQINSFVKTNVGLDTIVCQITGEHEFESNIQDIKQYDSSPFQVDLEVRGRIINGEFKAGLRCLPIVGAKIEMMDDDDYSIINGSKRGICIGVNLFNTSANVVLSINKLIPSHIGIFGNTGSGKSNTLSRILREYLNTIRSMDVKNGRVIIFDLNDEYGGSSIVGSEIKIIYPLSTRKQLESINKKDKIPLSLEYFTEDTWGILLRATQKTQMPIIRSAYKAWKERKDHEYIDRIKWMLIDRKVQIFFTLRYYLQDYVHGLDVVEYNNVHKVFYYNNNGSKQHINNMDDCPTITVDENMDDFSRFIFCLFMEIVKSSDSGTNFDYIQPLMPRAKALSNDFKKVFDTTLERKNVDIFDGKPLAVIQLGNVNANMRGIIPSLITDLLFQDAADDRGDSKPSKITSIVVDEAHNLLSYDPNTNNDHIYGNTLQVFEKVIKEGRKYGLFLYLSSQRPSDISDTITSQIHNYFIHKLVNPRDIEKIRKTVSFMGDNSLGMLPSLGQGECIITGPSLSMPQYVYVTELDDETRPNSADIVLFGKSGIFGGDNES